MFLRDEHEDSGNGFSVGRGRGRGKGEGGRGSLPIMVWGDEEGDICLGSWKNCMG